MKLLEGIKLRRLYLSIVFIILFIIGFTTVKAQNDLNGTITLWYKENFKEKISLQTEKIIEPTKDFYFMRKQSEDVIDRVLTNSSLSSNQEITTRLEQYKQELSTTKKQLLSELKNDDQFKSKEKEYRQEIERMVIQQLEENIDY